MQLTDTHCHIHSADYALNPDQVIAEAQAAGVWAMICVGTDAIDSRRAADFVQLRRGCWAAAGLHPHDAKLGASALDALNAVVSLPKVVAIGECGLDYFYGHSPKDDQLAALKFQLELASQHDLPLILHIRQAFDDFWPVFDAYRGLRGVVHSFSAGLAELEQILNRDLYVGLNGIMTFSRDPKQLAAARRVPLDRLMLETDAPFLTPAPHRGKVNQPKNIGLIAQFLAELRQEEVINLASATTANARELFQLKDK